VAKIKGNNNANLLNGTNNKDKIWGVGDDYIIDGFGGNDSIYAGTGADTVHGGNGHDYIDGGDGDDVLFGDAGTRAAWSFQYSIATGLNGETTDLDSFDFKLLIDVDPTAGTSYVTLELEPEVTPQAAGQSGFQWRDEATTLVPISDDEGNANVTQNSQNYAFYGVPGYEIGNGFARGRRFSTSSCRRSMPATT